MKTIKIADDYTDTPVGRFLNDGPFSGERFRESYLRPNLANGQKLKVDLDGVEGCGSSFLEEAFGGLVRKGYYTAAELRERLQVTCTDKTSMMYRDLIWKHIGDAKKE